MERAEERVSTLCEIKVSRDAELEKVLMKMSVFQQSLKEREKIVVVLQSELKLLKGENSRLNEVNSDLEEKIYLKDEEISSLKEKVVDQIEDELNY